MSSPQGPARPSQVTVAGWGIAIAALLLVVSVFDAMANLRSVDMREQITEAVTTGSAKDLGLSVETALEIMRWALFVAGFAGVAAGILGIFVLQRNKGARIGLSVAAVPIVLTAPLAGSFLGMFIAAGTTILWTRPARDWFAGRQPSTPSRPEQSSATTQEFPRFPQNAPAPPGVQHPTAPSGENQPPPMIGWGQAPDQAPVEPPAYPPPAYPPPVYPPPASPPPGPNPYGYYPPAPRPPAGPRTAAPQPREVRIGCIVTWVFSTLAALAGALVLIAVAVDSSAVLEIIKDIPGWNDTFDEDRIITATTAVAIGFLLWSVAAATLAFLAWRRVRWAWVLLLISTGVAAVVSIVGFPASLPHMTAMAVTLGTLLHRRSRDWFLR